MVAPHVYAIEFDLLSYQSILCKLYFLFLLTTSYCLFFSLPSASSRTNTYMIWARAKSPLCYLQPPSICLCFVSVFCRVGITDIMHLGCVPCFHNSNLFFCLFFISAVFCETFSVALTFLYHFLFPCNVLHSQFLSWYSCQRLCIYFISLYTSEEYFWILILIWLELCHTIRVFICFLVHELLLCPKF